MLSLRRAAGFRTRLPKVRDRNYLLIDVLLHLQLVQKAQPLKGFAKLQVVNAEGDVRWPLLASLIENPVNHCLEFPDKFLGYYPLAIIRSKFHVESDHLRVLLFGGFLLLLVPPHSVLVKDILDLLISDEVLGLFLDLRAMLALLLFLREQLWRSYVLLFSEAIEALVGGNGVVPIVEVEIVRFGMIGVREISFDVVLLALLQLLLDSKHMILLVY